MDRVTLKSSTIFIAMGGKTEVYRSVAEVPSRLRRKLVETTSSMNSATILIADRAGREEIAKAIRGLPSAVESRVARRAAANRRRIRLTWKQAAEILLPGAIGLAVWLLFSLK